MNSRTSRASSQPLLNSSLAFLQPLLHLQPTLGHNNFSLESGPPGSSTPAWFTQPSLTAFLLPRFFLAVSTDARSNVSRASALSARAKPQENPTYQLTPHRLKKDRREGAGHIPVLPLPGCVTLSDLNFLSPSFLIYKMGETRCVVTVTWDPAKKRYWRKILK